MLLPESFFNQSAREIFARSRSQLRASGPLTAELFRRLPVIRAKLGSVSHDEGRRRTMTDAGIQAHHIRRAERLPVMIKQDRNTVVRGGIVSGQLEGRGKSCVHEATMRLPFRVSSITVRIRCRWCR